MGNKHGKTSESTVPPAQAKSGAEAAHQVMSFKKRRGAVKKAYRGRMKVSISVDDTNADIATIKVHLDTAKDIAITTLTVNAYVKIEMIPEVKGCDVYKTPVVTGSRSPKFDENVSFTLKPKELDLSAHRLVFNLRNNKPDGRIEAVGGFSFSLDEIFEPEIDGWPKGGVIDSWFKIFDAQKGATMHMRHIKKKVLKKGDTTARKKSKIAAPDLKVGDRVWVEGKGAGKVAFVGPHHETGQPRIGVILDAPMGKNNGTVHGHKYFECEDEHGTLTAPVDKKGKVIVTLETPETAPKPAAADGVYADTTKFEGVIQELPPEPKTKMSKKKIRETDFRYLKVIGRGSFGKVFLAEKPGSNDVFAIKVLKKTKVLKDDDVAGTMIEKRTMELSEGCNFITKLHATFQTKANLFFVMEFVNGGDLMYWIMKKHKFTTDMSRFFCAEILVALWYLHDNGVIYRDLKLDNVLLTAAGHIKLTDFGLSKENVFGAAQTTTFCGTPTYLAPEILNEEPYGHGVDLWSLGVLAHEFVVGVSPFESPDDDELFYQVLTKKISIPDWCNKEAKSFIMGLMQRDPSNRLGCSAHGKRDLVNHPFFKPINWKKLAKMQVTPPFVPKINNPKDAELFDDEFTTAAPTITPPDESKLSDIDPDEFKGFSFVNRTGIFGDAKGNSFKKAANKSDLRQYKWYKPLLTRAEIQSQLDKKPVGTFCIRESKTQPGCYALAVAVQEGEIYTGLITPYPDPQGGVKYALISKVRFVSVPDLVDYYKLHPIPHGNLTTMLANSV